MSKSSKTIARETRISWLTSSTRWMNVVKDKRPRPSSPSTRKSRKLDPHTAKLLRIIRLSKDRKQPTYLLFLFLFFFWSFLLLLFFMFSFPQGSEILCHSLSFMNENEQLSAGTALTSYHLKPTLPAWQIVHTEAFYLRHMPLAANDRHPDRHI